MIWWIFESDKKKIENFVVDHLGKLMRRDTHRITRVTSVTYSRRLGRPYTHSCPACRGSRLPRIREAFLSLHTKSIISPARRTPNFQLPGNRHRVLAIRDQYQSRGGHRRGEFPSPDIGLSMFPTEETPHSDWRRPQTRVRRFEAKDDWKIVIMHNHPRSAIEILAIIILRYINWQKK